MEKTAFLFAGQGAQYVAMGKELYDQVSVSRQVFEEVDESLHQKLSDKIFYGEKEDLNVTETTQPAVVAVSMAAYRAFEQYGIKGDVAAGLSLGEYSALTASGVFTLSDVIPLVQKRGRFMQEAVPEGLGKMSAVLGLSEEKVQLACEGARSHGLIELSNINCPGQIVIGGEREAVEEASRLAIELGAKRIIDLAVSAPFHTSLLKPAAVRLKEELDGITLGTMKIPVISNVHGDYIRDSEEVKDLLYHQVMSSVLWEKTIRRMIEDGVRSFIEFGPGKTLSGFVKKIDRSLGIYHVEDMASLKTTVKALEGFH